MDEFLTAQQIAGTLGLGHLQQFERWAEKWDLKPWSKPGRRPRLYRLKDVLEACEREYDDDSVVSPLHESH